MVTHLLITHSCITKSRLIVTQKTDADETVRCVIVSSVAASGATWQKPIALLDIAP